MTNKPILFSAPMIRALLAGNKTQTRRLLTKRNTSFDGGKWPNYMCENQFHWDRAWIDNGPSPAGNAGPYLKLPVSNLEMRDGGDDETVHRIYPQVQVGDRLWVREAWRCRAEYDAIAPRDLPHGIDLQFVADSPLSPWDSRFRQALHMPRWASRLTLIVTDVRLQRLQDITDDDALAEGVTRCGWAESMAEDGRKEWHMPRTYSEEKFGMTNAYPTPWGAAIEFFERENHIYLLEQNPWVAAYTFTVARGNIDAADAPNGEGE
jgi:hypothetical protein